MPRLTDRLVSALKPPATGAFITFDADVPGFGVRVTAAGAKSWILDYRIDGRQRRYTIGRVAIGLAAPDPEAKVWNTVQARLEASRLRREIDLGRDPMGDRQDARNAPTVAKLSDRFMREYIKPKRRARTVEEYQSLVDQHIVPALGSRKVSALTHSEVEQWHAKIAKGTPIRANRALATLSCMLGLAADKWGMCDRNPCKGIERTQENKRSRYATADELKRLIAELAKADDQPMARALLLLALSGARRGEVLNAKWAQFDTERGVWTKPASLTKQNKPHVVPLSSSAMAVLASLDDTGPELFAGGVKANGQRLRTCWHNALKAAGITGLRVHDLRHGFASILASQPGASLPLIGAMLGHSVPSTTARYMHLFDDPQRAAAERVGQFIEAVATGKQAEILPIKASK